MSEVLPQQLGGFAIERELGRGGSGVVYAARWDDRPIALKVLLADDNATAKERARFLVEAQHLQRIAHPNVVRVFAAGELPDGRPYLAMERLHGSNLGERLLLGRLPVGVALELFAQLARAIAALHGAGIVHRDIKPENIMLVDSGQRAVLLDFGIARGVDDAESTTTQLGMQRGTPAYMAPERFFGARASIGSDVYETAVVLYVMLTGQLPWADVRNPQDRLEPMPPSRRGLELPPGLERELMRALSPKPESRPASIEELAAAVARVQWDGETVRANTERGTALPFAAPTRKVARSAVIGGLVAAVAAVTVVITIGVVSGWRGGEGGSTTTATVALEAGPPTASPVDAAPIPTLMIVTDAGVGRGAESGSAQPTKTTGAKSTRARAPGGSAGGSAGSGVTVPAPSVAPATGKPSLPSCAKWAALYCTKEFQDTEGGLAGVLCTNMKQTVATFRALPVDALDGQEASCAKSLGPATAAVNERLRQWRAGVGPGQPTAPATTAPAPAPPTRAGP